MKVEQVAPGVLRIAVARLDAVNVYLLEDVLLDSGSRFQRKRLLSVLSGRSVRAHALTHAHFDHQGSSHYLCDSLGIPLLCGEGDRRAVELGNHRALFPKPEGLSAWLGWKLAGPSHPVTHTLKEGDSVGGFKVLETPGHTPGHLAFWREADRLLIVGDVLFHRNPVTLRPGLQEPFLFATKDAVANRSSARRLASLNPTVICFGHGAPLRSVDRLQQFVSTLSA
jgi:hydroxyacylglutathione hydrolase